MGRFVKQKKNREAMLACVEENEELKIHVLLILASPGIPLVREGKVE